MPIGNRGFGSLGILHVVAYRGGSYVFKNMIETMFLGVLDGRLGGLKGGREPQGQRNEKCNPK